MNKVFNINLGNFPLTIDEDAYRHLENYLQSLHNHFRNSEGYEEIMNDIEARLGELMREGMGKRAIATIQDVKNAVSVMGTPEDFGAESINETTQKSKSSSSGKSNTEGGIKTGKRLFRDEDDKVIGGVCSGIAAYFGIEDPLWVRLAFIGGFFMWGTGFLFYFVLMAILPKATSTADRLAMKGEPVDVNSIAKAVADGVETFSQKVNEFGKPENQAKFNSQVHNVSDQIGNIVQTILSGIGGIWKVVIAGIVIISIIAMVASWIGGAIGLAMAYPMFGFVTDSNIAPPLMIFAAFCAVTAPIILMVLFLSRLLLKRPAKGVVIGSLWAVFGISIGLLASFAGKTAKEFTRKAEFTQNIDLANPNAETLNISFIENPNADDLHAQLGDVRVSEDFLIVGDTYVRLEKSNTDKFELSKTVYSRGHNIDEARQLCSNIDLKIESVNNDLRIPNEIEIPKGTKYRGQHVNVVLKVPVGKRVNIKRNGNGNIHVKEASGDDDDSEDNHLCWDSNEDDTALWEMTEKGMKCLNK